MRRTILVPLTIFGIVLALVTYYIRMRAIQQLDLAMSIVDASPKEAFMLMEPLLDRQGFPALGRVESAQSEFVSKLYDRCIAGLKKRPPEAMDFRSASQTLGILQQMGLLGVPNVHVYIRNILQAAREAVPSLESSGRNDAWQAMRAMFIDASNRLLIPDDSRADFNAWFGGISDPGRQESVVIRDSVQQAQDRLNEGLRLTGIAPSGSAETIVSAFPAKYSDDSARELSIAIDLSNRSLTEHYDRLPTVSGVPRLPVPDSLLRVRSLITYDYSALLIHQLGILKATPGRRRSAFVASCTIQPFQVSVPDPDQLFNRYIALTTRSLWESFQDIGKNGFSPDDAAAFSALRLRNQVLLDRTLEAPEGGLENQYRQVMDWLGARPRKSVLSAAIEKGLRERPDAILIIADLTSLSLEEPAGPRENPAAQP